MFFWAMSFLAFLNFSIADAGKVVRIVNEVEAYCLRGQQKLPLSQDFPLMSGDEVFSEKSILSLKLPSGTQLSMAEQSHVKISQNVGFPRGLIQVLAEKKQIVDADGVSFTGEKAQFEVSYAGESVDLDVIYGEVEVTSPYVQTFVPEIIKADQGFRFNKKERSFSRRKFSIKFKNAPSFDKKKKG